MALEISPKKILESAEIIVLVLDLKGKISYINRGGAKILEGRKNEIIGKDWFANFLPTSIRNKIKKVFYDIIQGKIEKFENYKNEIITQKKKEKIILWHNSVIKDKNGKISFVLSTGIDISEQEEMEKKFQAINESAQDAIILIDSNGNISFWNKAAEKIFGYSSKEALGKNLHILLAPKEYFPLYKKSFASFKKTGKGRVIGRTIKLNAKTKNRGIIPIELSISSVKLRGKWNAIGIIRDLSKNKRIEEELKKRNEELEKINKFAIDREIRMVELKKEINSLLEKLNKKPKYKIAG